MRFPDQEQWHLHCMSLVINRMLCHGVAPTSVFHAAVIPIPKYTQLNFLVQQLSSNCIIEYFSKIVDRIMMSLPSDYFKEHSSNIMCSTLLVETVEHYVSNNSTVYVRLIDASK